MVPLIDYTQILTPLLTAAKNNDLNGVRAALAEHSGFNYVHTTLPYNGGYKINALEIAIINGNTSVVRCLLDLNFDIDTKEVERDRCGNLISINDLKTIPIAFLHFNKEIIDLLINKLEQQIQYGCNSKIYIPERNKKSILTSGLIDALKYTPKNLIFKIVDQFVTYGADLFEAIDTLLHLNPPGLKAYFDRHNPGKIIHSMIRRSYHINGLKDLNTLLSLGYSFVPHDEDNDTPFIALADCNIRGRKFKRVQETIVSIFNMLIPLHLLPSYNDIEYFAKNNALELLAESLIYMATPQMKDYLSADQYAKIFQITIAHCLLHLNQTKSIWRQLLDLSPQAVFLKMANKIIVYTLLQKEIIRKIKVNQNFIL